VIPGGTTTACRFRKPSRSAPDSVPYVAVVNEHRLEAREGDQVAWAFTAEARVSSPPVLHEGHVYFGAHDGYVYCLDEKNGGLKWRFLAAPTHKWMIAFGSWNRPPRSSTWCRTRRPVLRCRPPPRADGGLIVWRLEPATGKIKEKKPLRRGVEWAPADAKQFAGLQNFIINDPLRVIDGKLMLYGQDVNAHRADASLQLARADHALHGREVTKQALQGKQRRRLGSVGPGSPPERGRLLNSGVAAS
jgi:hypothetical protein